MGGTDSPGDCGSAAVLQHALPVYMLARRLCGDTEDAARVTREALVEALLRVGEAGAGSDFTVGIYRIAMGVCQNEARRWARRVVKETLVSGE